MTADDIHTNMHSIDSLRALVSKFGEVKPQPPTDWAGSFPLPTIVEMFYREIGPWGGVIHQSVGPVGLTLCTGGNPVTVPPLHKLWNYQAGYRWNSVTGKRERTWKDEWLLIAEEGGDPFILDMVTSNILFAHHGAGGWHPKIISHSLYEAIGAIATVAQAYRNLGDDALDETYELRPESRIAVEIALGTYFGNLDRAKNFLATWGWYL